MQPTFMLAGKADNETVRNPQLSEANSAHFPQCSCEEAQIIDVLPAEVLVPLPDRT